jgi:membrane-bound lytic murein transglycosylase B
MLKLWLVFFLALSPIAALADSYFTQRADVQAFISEMVKKHHFKRQELVTLFDGVKPRPKVIKQIKAPLEKKPWNTYQRLFVTEWRIREGVAFWKKYADTLKRAEQTYGVPASIIVATIGIETKYGRNTGEYPVIDALVNIAFGDTGRNKYFRSELKEFLLLTREQHLDPKKVTGSYAGAIGQPQFMPSSYRNYAVNFSGSGKIDLSHSEVDVIGSIANYYQKHGWETNKPVAIPASTQGGKYQIRFMRPRSLSKSELIESGVIPANLKHEKYTIIPLQGYYGNEYWLGFHNFNVIKRYNSSDLYAMAVYQLSYYINELKERSRNAAWT